MLLQAEADYRNVPTVQWLVAEPEAGELKSSEHKIITHITCLMMKLISAVDAVTGRG